MLTTESDFQITETVSRCVLAAKLSKKIVLAMPPSVRRHGGSVISI